MRIPRWVYALTYYSFFTFLVLLGLHGLLVPTWAPVPEADVYAGALFTVDLPAEIRAGMLNQYRYLKVCELMIGVFALMFRREVFTDPRMNRFLLTTLFLGAAARLLSLAHDGLPGTFYLLVTAAEVLVFLILFAYTHRAFRSHPA